LLIGVGREVFGTNESYADEHFEQSVRYEFYVPQPNKIAAARRGRPSRVAIYDRLRVQIGELRERLGGLPSPIEAEGIWRGIWLEEAHHSTAIEGNTLVLKQVELLLAEGRAVGNKELSEYLEIRGYATEADWVYGHGIQPGEWSEGELVSLAEVRRVHSLAMTPVWDVSPHPRPPTARARAHFASTTSNAFPAACSPRHGPRCPRSCATGSRTPKACEASTKR
jgi:hypothetical protein